MSSCRFSKAMCALSTTIVVLLAILRVNVVHAQDGPPRSTEDVPRLQLTAAAGLTGEQALGLSDAVQRPPRRHTGYLIFGVSMLISGYLSSVALGALITDLDSYECEHEHSRACEHARPFFIPVLGPLFAKSDYPDVLPVYLVSTQLIGLTFSLLGALLEPSKRSPASTDRMRIRVAAVPLPGGALLSTQVNL